MLAFFIFIAGLFVLFELGGSIYFAFTEFEDAYESDELMEYKEHLGKGILFAINTIGIILSTVVMIVLYFSK